MASTALILRHQLTQSLRTPGWLVIGLAQPVLYLALFGPLLETFAEPFGFDAWLVFTPGLLVLLGMFGGMSAGFGIVSELRAGVIERQRVTPATRLSLLMGRVYREGVVVAVQSAILIGVALAFGLRPHWIGVVITLVLVALLTTGIAAACVALGLATRSESGVAAVTNGLSLPIMLLGGILIPMQFAPDWLAILSRVNPIRYTVEAARDLFAGELASGDVLLGTTVTVALVAVLIAIGTRRFQRENA